MNNEEINIERLGKIVKLAKNGIGGEKDAAMNVLRSLCAKHGLNIDDVMNSIEKKEFWIEISDPDEEVMAIRCIYRYGILNLEDAQQITVFSHSIKRNRKKIGFISTTEKHVEVLNAYSVLVPLYKKERVIAEIAFSTAFANKHNLFYQPREDEEEKAEETRKKQHEEKTEDQQQADEMASDLKRHLKHADIHKQIENK